jgi:hypothetical protein
MRRITILILALMTACAPTEEAATDTAGAMAVSLSDFAGTWDGTVKAQGSDSVIANIELLATSTNEGWSFTVVNAANPALASTTPARVTAIEGDSLILEAGPFESILRAGQQVSTRSVYRLRDGRMVGAVQAVYAATGDTIMLNSEATRRR